MMGGEDEPDKPARQVMVSRVMVVDSETLAPNVRLAVASISQTQSGLRVTMHDKHGPLVSLGEHLGLFADPVLSAEPMSAEEWKRQFVREG
jgi:hypothetical protein